MPPRIAVDGMVGCPIGSSESYFPPLKISIPFLINQGDDKNILIFFLDMLIFYQNTVFFFINYGVYLIYFSDRFIHSIGSYHRKACSHISKY